MRLYHGSSSQLSLGQINASYPSKYYPNVVAELERSRPAQKPSRSICLFAADSIVGATSFMVSQKMDEYWIYEVEMPEFHQAPFRLVHEIDTRIRAGAVFQKLVDEYWSPSIGWYFQEYFGPTIEVIRQVPAADLIELSVFNMNYFKDIEISKSLV